MNNRKVVILIAFFAIVVLFGLQHVPGQNRSNAIEKWEYKTTQIEDYYSEKELNIIGDDGWELVQVNFTHVGGSSQVCFGIFKRPKK
jgi:hypothetical protein